MKANGFATTPEGKRCLRAWPLLALSEDGDGFYADAMARQLDHARNEVESLICDALEEMAARGGRIAFEKLSESGDKCKPAPEERDPRKRWMTNLMNFMTGDKDSNANEGNSTQGASTAGGEQDAPPTIVGDPAGDFDARVRAFLSLARTREGVGTIPLYDLLAETPPTALSYLAGQYLEDTTKTSVETSLLECAKDAKAEMPIRQRCVIGLAMTRTSYRLPEESADALWAGLAAQELQPMACRLTAEMLARQQEISAPANCANPPPLPSDATDRWRTHRQALLQLLIDQRATHGPYMGETQSFHEEQLALLKAQDEL